MRVSNDGTNEAATLLNTPIIPSSSLMITIEVVPPPTRHRGVLTLERAFRLYDMQFSSRNSLSGIIESSRNAIPVMKTNQVSTKRLMKRMDGSGMSDLEVTFFSCSQENRDNQEIPGEKSMTLMLSIPCDWTPNTFLAMLNKSANKKRVISLEQISNPIYSYTTINEIHLYHPLDPETIDSVLSRSAAYLDVKGGVLVDPRL